MLDLKPIATVDKSIGAYDVVARARSWRKAISAMAQQVAKRFAPDASVRVGLVRAEGSDDTAALLHAIGAKSRVVWSGVTEVGAALAVHTGPKAAAFAVAPGTWPWESDVAN